MKIEKMEGTSKGPEKLRENTGPRVEGPVERYKRAKRKEDELLSKAEGFKAALEVIQEMFSGMEDPKDLKAAILLVQDFSDFFAEGVSKKKADVLKAFSQLSEKEKEQIKKATKEEGHSKQESI